MFTQFNLANIVKYIGGNLVSNGSIIPVTQDPDTVLFNKVAGEIQGFKTLAGTPVPTVSYDFTVAADLFALNPATVEGEVFRLKKTALTGDGAQDTYWYSDGSNILPLGGRQLLFSINYGTIASAAKTLSAAGRFSIVEPVIPANMISKNGMSVEGLTRLHRRGISATNLIYRTYLGPDSTTATNNAMVTTRTCTNTDLLDFTIRSFSERQSATSCTVTREGQENAGGAASTFVDLADNGTTVRCNYAADQEFIPYVFGIDAANNLDLWKMMVFINA